MSIAKNVIQMQGERYGALVVLEYAGTQPIRGRISWSTWRCRCDCGQELIVRGIDMRRDRRKACGINGHRWIAPRPIGVTTRYRSEYKSWTSMWDRCTKPRVKNFKNYGGRGIEVCDRWKSFPAFLEDMGPKPSSDLMIERKDTNGNYEPGNCIWTTNAEQQRNRRNCVFVEYEGQRMLMIDVVDKLGLSRAIVYGRLKNGWSLGAALSIPAKKYKPRAKIPPCQP